MADWTGAGMDIATRYAEMAEYGFRGVSPSYERLAVAIAADPVVLSSIGELPTPKQQPNLLLGAVRYLGGPVAEYGPFRNWLLAHWPAVADLMRRRSTQTNEPLRCATMLPALAALPQPLALLEVGASAGLCLLPDRYAYRFVTAAGVHAVGSGPVELTCTVAGPAPLPTQLPSIVWRAGLDLNPLDVSSPDDLRWLESLIWPEEIERFARLHAAAATVRADPPRIVRGDLLVDLPGLVAQAPSAATLVIMHSAALAYVDAAGRASFAATIDRLRSERDLVWLSNEAPGVVAGTDADFGDTAHFVLARDEVPLALTGQHGRSVEWLS